MKATPTWFGPMERRLFGSVHLPEGATARGVVVMCPPIGKEAGNAVPALQALANHLAEVGVAAVRFAYAGTGDSAGSLDDPERLSDWLASIDEAVSLARRSTSGPVVLLGIRMGALLAAEAIARGTSVDHLILWDSYSSGRQFLRIERTLLTTWYGVPQAGDGSVTGPAFSYSAETVEELSGLEFAPGGGLPSAGRTLVLVRREGSRLSPVAEGSLPVQVDWIEVDGQPELMDVPPQMVTLPSTAIKAITEWVTRHVDPAPSPIHLLPVASSPVALTPDGRAITERAVWLGPNSLFGMVTEPGTDDVGAPTIVLLSAGALDHTGAGRMWVELARQFAAYGLRCIRVDIDGIGETFGRAGLARQVPKPPEAIDDMVDLAEALGDPEGRNLILVGLSSGGYHAIEAGLILHPQGVCAINPGLTGLVPEEDQGTVDPRRRAFRPMPAALRRLAIRHSRSATWLWRLLCQVWVKGSPIHPVAEVSRRGIPVLVIVSEDDEREFEPSAYWSVVRWWLRRRGLLSIEVVPGDDHSLYTVEGKTRAYPLLTRWVQARTGRPTGQPGPTG